MCVFGFGWGIGEKCQANNNTYNETNRYVCLIVYLLDVFINRGDR